MRPDPDVPARYAPLALAASILLLSAPSTLASSPSGVAPGRHVLHGARVRITNVIGATRVVPGEGSGVVVEVTPGGKDGGRLRVVTEECGGATVLRVVYPSDRIVDPKMNYHGINETTFDDCGRRQRIRFTRPGEGLDAHADLVIRVPRDQNLSLQFASAEVDVNGVRADLDVDTGGGRVTVRKSSGSVKVDVGSGSVALDGVMGTVAVASGSGDVEGRDLNGALSIETGSGGIDVERVRANNVTLSCGSGRVTAGHVIAAMLRAESGSGDIELSALNAPRASIECGSGGATIDLAGSPEKLRIESGSGGVRITAPKDLSARLDIECSKRQLDIAMPVVVEAQDEGMLHGRVGSGKGSIAISTGSGGVSLHARED